MEKVNYSKLYTSLVKGLSDKTREVFSRRFGINGGEPETLEAIGQILGITRERVRQIQDAGFASIKAEKKEILEKAFKELANYFKNKGGLRREDLVLEEVGGKNQKPYILFLLNAGDFNRVCEKKDYFSFWTTIANGEGQVKNTLGSLAAELVKNKTPLAKKQFVTQFATKYNLTPVALNSYLEVAKNVKENAEGMVGLIDWPEISPRGVRDRAFLVFKKHAKPLHFREVAIMIDRFNYNLPNKQTLPQTVHNELIKDPRFVLVGRGTYALKEWGYNPGTVKDVIVNVLQNADQPINKETLIEKVLAQRLVAKNTVLMNLNDKTHFSKDEKGKYILRKTQTS